ncbi:MAG TPA: glycosyltransferase family 39 protein [Polyangiaceae bacterium]
MLDESRASRRQLVAALAATVPLALLTCWMAVPGNSPISVPFGFLCSVTSIVGILALLQGSERGPITPAPALEGNARALLRELLLLAVTLGFFVIALRAAVSGVLPAPRLTAALLMPAAFLASAVASFRLGRELGWVSGERSLFQRYGFWLMLFHAIVYWPLCGSFSLIDPWETHYGEVAREMLARDDWISLWWAQDGWFWSKPVLDFWLQALSFAIGGVQFLPDQMLSGIAAGHTPYPEWAARTPIGLMTVIASYCFYKALARSVHPRAGFLAALVLGTTPYWFLIAHQTMTDMPYVAALVICLSCFLLAQNTDAASEVQATHFRLGPFEIGITPAHALAALVLLCVLPQVCYLVSRNLTLDLATGALEIHGDRFMAGSGGGNCGLPGNQACRTYVATYRAGQPALLACLWLFLGLWLTRELCQETRARPLFYCAAWLALAWSVMAKGAPGLVLPLGIIVVFVGATRRWSVLLELRPRALLFVFAVVALPWHVQMVLRHGHGFVDRLLLHDMYKRAFDHVHDTNEGIDVSFRYYVWQLGYGLFPWFGLAIVGVLDWLRRQFVPARDQPIAAREAATLMGLWFIVAFSLFTVSGTKFHHYVLPAVPPLCALTGLSLHELLGKFRLGRSTRAPDNGPRSAASFASAAEPGNLLILSLVASLSLVMVGRDLLVAHGERLPGQVLFMQLFTYQYKRPWPDHLDFSTTLLAFTALATLLCLCLGSRALRQGAVLGLCALATAWAAWGVNVYLVQAAPHWGQRESIAAYYRARTPKDAPLVAFQMNWKGENFYTGNHLAAFVRSGEAFQQFMKQKRAEGVRTLYFTTEPSRFGALRREVGEHKSFQVLTDDRVNNKFAIAKIEF